MKKYVKADYFYDNSTERGKRNYRSIKDFPELYENYDPHAGSCMIIKPDFKRLQGQINEFLRCNRDWGIDFSSYAEWYDDEGEPHEGCYFICPLADFNAWDMRKSYDRNYKKRNGLL